MADLNAIGWLALRVSLAGVYLYALYLNTHDRAAREWLVQHTAYIFQGVPEPRLTALARAGAVAGMMMMLVGGTTVILGIGGRFGAFVLLLFTLGGIYQHRREREIAMAVAKRLAANVAEAGKADLSTLQWSAYSGHLSSGLKNWALCGACLALVVWGTGPYSLSYVLGGH